MFEELRAVAGRVTLHLAEEDLTRNVPRAVEDLLQALRQLPAVIEAFTDVRSRGEAGLGKPPT